MSCPITGVIISTSLVTRTTRTSPERHVDTMELSLWHVTVTVGAGTAVSVVAVCEPTASRLELELDRDCTDP